MNQEADIRELFSDALNGDEPPHRDMAEGSIVRGDRVRKRNRIVGAGSGAVLTAAAVFGTMAISTSAPRLGAGGGNRGTWIPTVNLNIGDKQRDINANLPTLLDKFLPAGDSLSWSNNIGDDPTKQSSGTYQNNGSSFTLTSKDGRDNASFITVPRGNVAETTAPALSGLPAPVLKTASVPGGTVTTTVWYQHDTQTGKPYTDADYMFSPTDATKQTVSMSLMNDRDHPGLSPDEFVAMAGKPGFEQVRALVDNTVPASAAAKQERTAIDAEITKIVASALPAGYSLKLSTTDLSGQYDLTGPGGRVAFSWTDHRPEPSAAEILHSCEGSGPGGKVRCSMKKVSGGSLIESHFDTDPAPANSGMAGRFDYNTSYVFYPDVKGVPLFEVDLDSGSPQTALTADQFLAMAHTPGIDKMVKDTAVAITK